MICSVPNCGQPTPFPPYTVADSTRPLCEDCYGELREFVERAKAAVERTKVSSTLTEKRDE